MGAHRESANAIVAGAAAAPASAIDDGDMVAERLILASIHCGGRRRIAKLPDLAALTQAKPRVRARGAGRWKPLDLHRK